MKPRRKIDGPKGNFGIIYPLKNNTVYYESGHFVSKFIAFWAVRSILWLKIDGIAKSYRSEAQSITCHIFLLSLLTQHAVLNRIRAILQRIPAFSEDITHIQ